MGLVGRIVREGVAVFLRIDHAVAAGLGRERDERRAIEEQTDEAEQERSEAHRDPFLSTPSRSLPTAGPRAPAGFAGGGTTTACFSSVTGTEVLTVGVSDTSFVLKPL